MSITIVSSFVKTSLQPPSPEGSATDPLAVGAALPGLDFASVLLGLPTVTAPPPAGDETASGAETALGELSAPLAVPQFPIALTLAQPDPAASITATAASKQFDISLPTAALLAPQPPASTNATLATAAPALTNASSDERWSAAASTADGKAAKFAVTIADIAAQTTWRSEAKGLDPRLSPASGLATMAPGNPFPATLAGVSQETSASLPTALRDPSWASELGQKLLWFVGNDKQLAQLTLNPPQLGSLEITLKLDKDGANAHFVSANAEVRGAIETALPRLREMFATAGIDLGQVSVGSESFRQHADGRQEGSGAPRQMGDKAILGVASTSGLVDQASAMSYGSALIDTFA